jgi:TonB family protein
MNRKLVLILFILLSIEKVYSSDTLYFKLSNPWNTVKDIKGNYTRKSVAEKDYFHVWDYNKKNKIVTESFYTDTNFVKKLFCHKYYNEEKGYLEQTRCYENGRLDGYFVIYDEKGDTTDYTIYKNGDILKSWSLHPEDNEDFIANEVEAKFQNGENDWNQYLQKNIKVPTSSGNQNIKGQVIVKFTIETTGKIGNTEIIKSLNPIFDKEAIRVIKKSPKWKPAMQKGKKVQATRTQPITFG